MQFMSSFLLISSTLLSQYFITLSRPHSVTFLPDTSEESFFKTHKLIKSLSSLIIDGKKSGSRPFFARFWMQPEDDLPKFCGGTILNERFVLTAAHCVHPISEKIKNSSIEIMEYKDKDSGPESKS